MKLACVVKSGRDDESVRRVAVHSEPRGEYGDFGGNW
jgi:hypothetical protein